MKKAFAIVLAIWAAACIIGCSAPEEISVTEPEGHRIVCMGTQITMNAPAASILEDLGEPISYTEETSCAFEGLDKTYYFGSFYLTTYPASDGDRTYSLWFADDSISTTEGITIGSSREAVEAAYGNQCFHTADICTLTRADSTLTIMLKEDAVSAIRYDAVIE